jgi:peptidyl-prolyl cis-trans isomerase D
MAGTKLPSPSKDVRIHFISHGGMRLDRGFEKSLRARFFNEQQHYQTNSMITWLQTFFLKHNKVLFTALLVVIIMTFVLTIGNQSFFGSDSGQQVRRLDYFGYNLASDRDMATIMQAAELSAMLNPEMRVQRENLVDYAYARVAALGLANQADIPPPSPAELENFIRRKSVFLNQEGQFDAGTYNQFVQIMSMSGRFTEESMARVLRDDYRVERVREALGGPGFVLPYEALKSYEEEETTWSLAVAERAFSDFQPVIEPSEEELLAF